MYTPSSFELSIEQSRDFIRARSFGTLVVSDGKRCEVVPLPLLLHENVLIGHVAKANPIWRLSGAAVVIFNGEDAYVSPAWYPSKAETGKVVPTWNYVAVTVDVAVESIHDAARKLEIVRALTDRHEAITGSGWSVDDAPVEFIDSNLKAIVGLELTIIQISGKAKLSQNRSPVDRNGVAEALKDSPIGSLMT